MVRWRRDQRDSRNRVTGSRYDIVHLIAGKLSSFARFRSLGDLDLDLVGVYQIFRGHAEASGGYLLDGGAER